jgi:hypothetical protein
MIQSKPKTTTIFSLSLFLLIAYGVGIWSWFSIPGDPGWWISLPIVCLAVALLVTVKILLGYRVLSVNGDRWQVSKLISRDLRFTGKDIEWWREIAIKTAGGQYKQLHIHAGKGVDVKVSLQEHTEYQKILKILKTKHRHKELKDTN